ncbi:uncharacterized protein LOC127738060 isoform X2 [Mytilus californianus]|uniref:uncharacterized protein LOC127738060 isoform X2 n=1 Tax=Mytilus californianus TaxID=6549 RepID=UPI002246D3C1|nr:uncharacterized protein LOC127738060 isoform X2 [Mytilus californianus]
MYYLRNGICQECPKGTYRFIDETECKKCSRGFYGRFCVQPCECKTGDCDPVEGTCKCERDDAECNHEDQYQHGEHGINPAAIIVPVLLILLLSVSTVFWIRLYKKFVLQHGENERTRQFEDPTTMSCLTHYINKIRVLFKSASIPVDPEHHNEEGNDEGHYCDIMESAMIRPLNSRKLSIDLEDDIISDNYNHLKLKIERKVPDVYFNNGNIYTKVNNSQSGKQNTVALPNYDRMELDLN